MKALKLILATIFGIINMFLSIFITYKVYGYFAPHTGLDLPELTYWQIFALQFIVSIFLMNITREMRIQKYENLMGKEENAVYTKTVALLIIWPVFYLISVIIF